MKKIISNDDNFCVQQYGICKFKMYSTTSKIDESTAPEKDVLNKMLRNRDAVIKEMEKHIKEINAAINKIDQ